VDREPTDHERLLLLILALYDPNGEGLKEERWYELADEAIHTYGGVTSAANALHVQYLRRN